MPELARPVLIGTVLVALFTFFFVYPGHDPKPNGLPVGVTQGAATQASQLGTGGAFEVKTYRDEDAARAAILDREIYAALVDGPKLLTAPAASYPVAQIATQVLGAGGRVPTEVVRGLDDGDPRGASLNLLILPLSITAILGALIAFQLAPALAPIPRIGLLGVFAVLGALAAVAIVRAIGALPGPVGGLLAVSALGIAATAIPAAGIIRAAGPPGVGLAFIVFLMLGNPSSGAASAPELLPEPWQTGGQFLPSGALAAAIRNVAYFDGAAVATPLIVLGAWVVIGVALLGVASRRPLAPPG